MAFCLICHSATNIVSTVFMALSSCKSINRSAVRVGSVRLSSLALRARSSRRSSVVTLLGEAGTILEKSNGMLSHSIGGGVDCEMDCLVDCLLNSCCGGSGVSWGVKSDLLLRGGDIKLITSFFDSQVLLVGYLLMFIRVPSAAFWNLDAGGMVLFFWRILILGMPAPVDSKLLVNLVMTAASDLGL